MGVIRFLPVTGMMFVLLAIMVFGGNMPKGMAATDLKPEEREPVAEVTIILPGEVTLVLVRIPAGAFMMGAYPGEQESYDSENPQHEVTLNHDFWMGKYEVTQ